MSGYALRAVLLIGVLGSASCAFSPSVDGSTTDDAVNTSEVREVARNSAALEGEIGACLDREVLRLEVTYNDGTFDNMQYRSADLEPEMRDWWERTDCAAMVVDWRRTPELGADGTEAYVNGMVRGDNETCMLAYRSRKIVSHYILSSADWTPVVENDTEGCESHPVWMGTLGGGPSPVTWFHYQSPVRAITQAWIYAFPAHVEAYMQVEHEHGCGEPENCCWGPRAPVEGCP